VKTITVSGRRKYEPRADDIDNVEAMEERASTLENTFISNLNSTAKGQLSGIETISMSSSSAPILPKGCNSEKLLVSMYEVYDDMIEQFESMDYTNPITQKVSNSITKLGSCIEYIGGKVEEFSPLDHVSGLTTPSMTKSAQQVVDRTKSCYKRAEIEDVSVSESGKVIGIVLCGQDENIGMAYRAKGTLTAKSSWSGTEAIDYIYTPAAGKMSVKVLEGEKWVDKSPNYTIQWELQEVDLNSATDDDLALFKRGYKKEGEISNKQNKITEDNKNSGVEIEEEEIDLDFPVQDK